MCLMRRSAVRLRRVLSIISTPSWLSGFDRQGGAPLPACSVDRALKMMEPAAGHALGRTIRREWEGQPIHLA